ncbi:uracil-DNA glycosylase family protein [Shimia sp. CNT1-13L.2]|uniref:uracil-DNA glycosylase family protein n=1 Tax=Shimia sp. CNT1-13L.2 TaxID=2959663 RepID=UPI0020CFB55D|nr:uracil-DNA glycosylase family protein [Shimia sp. CNT1-13L.2]MCP9482080.1 uracil-DNA glycosylase family protein [Shimia sp. CNT1-13L.2]
MVQRIEEELLLLARKRQASQWPGYRNIHEFHNGAYEADYISPWSKSAHNLESGIVILGQDWASEDFLQGPFNEAVARFGYDPKLPTNINLSRLLNDHLQLRFSDVWATNLFPFVKSGGMSAQIPAAEYRRAAVEFLMPALEIAKPKHVICLGAGVRRHFGSVAGLGKMPPMDIAISKPLELDGVLVHTVAHTGALGTNNRGKQRVEEDWKHLADRVL